MAQQVSSQVPAVYLLTVVSQPVCVALFCLAAATQFPFLIFPFIFTQKATSAQEFKK